MSGPGQTYGVSVFINPIIEDMGWSRTTVAGLYTAGSLTAATTMVFVGRLLDKYGARVMLMIIGTLFGFALIGMSAVSEPIHLYAGFVAIRTLGQGSMGLVSTTLVAIWFVRLRGRAMALYSLGQAASQAVFPLLIHILTSSVEWRGAWIILAFMAWGVVILPAMVLVRRSPESVGLLPDGDSIAIRETPSQRSAHRVSAEVNWTLIEVFRTRASWLLIFAGSSQSLISTALVFHHVSVMGSRGLDPGVAASVLSVLAPLSLVGMFLGGFLSDKIPNRYLLAVGQAILAVAMLWVLVISQNWQAFVYGGMLGLAGGLLMITNDVIWANYFGRRNLGRIRGVVFTSMVAFAALGPLPFGILFDLTANYTSAVLVFLALPVLCAAAALLAAPPYKKQPVTSGGAS
jgi:MFS family permease